MLLSPLDWALIESWQTREIPLAVVLRAIESVFERIRAVAPEKLANIKSLAFCRDEVEAQFQIWQTAQIGVDEIAAPSVSEAAGERSSDSDIFAPERIETHLRRARQIWQNTPRPVVNEFWPQLAARILRALDAAEQKFAETPDVERLETDLQQLDREVDRHLSEFFDAAERRRIERETSAQLRGYEWQMPPDVFARTFQALLVKNLRETADLPTFSLFYL